MFKHLKHLVQKQLEVLISSGTLFSVDIDREEVWRIYLENIPASKRQESNCNCCKSFLRQFSGIVGIKPDNTLATLWDFEYSEDDEYKEVPATLRRYVASLPVVAPFFSETKKCGTNETPDGKRQLVWGHFFLEIPAANVKKADSIPATIGGLRDDKNVLERSITEITKEAVDIVIDLTSQNSIYRGNEHLPVVKKFAEAHKNAAKIPKKLLSNYCWKVAPTLGAATCRIKNSAIGTLLENLSAGMELDLAVRKFEAVVAPANYKRPTSLITPRMVEVAEKRLTELGLTSALNRRQLSGVDLTVANALFVYRPKVKEKSIFAQLKENTVVNPKSLTKVEEIRIEDFISKVLPTTNSLKLLVENRHLSNLVSLVGPQDKEDSATLFKWSNNFSWSYVGDVADSIKERVKNAGGNVSGIIRVSLSWGNYDDLDLHVIEPDNNEIYFRNKVSHKTGGTLDVDMNAGSGQTREPVENIYWENYPSIGGEYKIIVSQFNRREKASDGFTVQIEHDGEMQEFHFPSNGLTGRNHKVASFFYSKKDGFSLEGGLSKGYNSQKKWGLSSGQFHRVKAITLSPNFWASNIGNKHFFFLLEGCKVDEKVRGFYNEFLKQELDGDRKVFEVLGSKVVVESSDDELSGLGFSETQKNHVFVEVEGSFKRQLKVNF